LVAGLNLPLHRDEDFDHLHHAGRQLIATLQLLDLIDKAALEALLGVLVLLADGLDGGHGLLVLEADLPPLAARDVVEDLVVDLGALARTLRSLRDFATEERVTQTAIDVTIEDLELVVAILGETLDLLALDRHGALVLLDAMAIEDAHLDDRSRHARRQTQ